MNIFLICPGQRLSRSFAWLRPCRLQLALGGALLAVAGAAFADYVPTAVNRIFIDPASVGAVADGYQNGDEVAFVFETTPQVNGNSVNGAGAWSIMYLPPGAEVIGAELAAANADGSYSAMPAKDLAPFAPGCGNRTCAIVDDLANPDRYSDGVLAQNQQDTGIFYSSDARLALRSAPLSISPGGTNVKPQQVWNDWDFDQIVAFGTKKPVAALSGNGGRGTTPVVSYGTNGPWFGTGSPVAGPNTYFSNDYNPSCDPTAGTGTVAFRLDLGCVGPWNRIAYANAKLAAGIAVVPGVASTGTYPGNAVDNTVLTTAGFVVSPATPLPTSTRAVRFVLGSRRVGDLEISRLVLRLTDAAAFIAAIDSGNKFCMSATGGDNVKAGRGPQDNIWRYYEGDNHICFKGDSQAVLLKQPKFVNGQPDNGATLAPNDVIGYEITFTNTSPITITNIVLSDNAGSNIALVAAGTAGCPYASYNGNQAGLPTLNTLSAATATWNALPSLPAGQSVKVFICARVAAAAVFGDQVTNSAAAIHDGRATPLTSSTLGTVSPRLGGSVYNDLDGSAGLTAGDVGLAGVTVQLWDSTGTSLLATTLTDGLGAYSFNGFPAATYLIRELDPAGFFSTGDTQGALTDNQISVTTLASGASLGHDFFDRETAKLNVTKTVDPNPVSLGEQATYTVTIVNTGPVATTANVVIADTLPTGITYVSASGTNWSCNGLVPLGCTFTGLLVADVGTTTLNILVNVGVDTLNGNNTARASGGGDTRCPVAPTTALARCSGTVIVGTVPVILSKVAVQVENGALVVRFGTASEDGALGFRVYASRAGEAARQALASELSLAQASLLVPQLYEVRGSYNGQTQVWIEELSIKGASTFYGPFAVGQSLGAGVAEVSADWSSIRAEQGAFRLSQRQSLSDQLTGGANNAQAEVRIGQSGWVRVRFEDLLAQGIDWTGVAAAQIELSRGAGKIPVEVQGGPVFGPGSALAFLAEAVTGSLYTKTAVYRLRVADAVAPLSAIFAGVGALPAQTQLADHFEHAPNRQYSSGSPLEDPWYALRLVRNGGPSASAVESFVLPDKFDGEKPEQIEVELWGGLDFPETPDHSLRLSLNDREIGRARFDGVTRHLLRAELPVGLLKSGSNTLTLELIGDTGLPADVVHLEAIRIDYRRVLKAVDDRIDFSLPADLVLTGGEADRLFVDDFDDGGSAACVNLSGCSAYTVSGMSGSDAVVLRERAGQVVRLLASRRTAGDGGYELRFASSRRPGDHYWVAPAAGAVAAAVTLAAAPSDPLAGASASYLIVAHPSFVGELAPLIAARQAEGFTVRVLNVEDLYRFYNDGVVDPIAIQLALSDAYLRLATRYVLLVGGDTLDYFNYTGVNSVSFVPTPYRMTHQFIRFGAADSAYADVDGDGLADLAIGRLPVRTSAELSAVITKTLAYANTSFGGQAALLSDRNSGGINYGDQLALIGNYLGNGWTMTTLRLQNYASGASAQARGDLVTAVNSGQSLVTYLGHSAPGSWTFEGLLTASQVYAGAFSNATKPTLVWNIGCYGSYFVDPNYNTIAHGLLLQNNGGAAAVLGASGLTNVSSDVAWINTLGPRLGSERIGDAQRLAQRFLYKAGSEFRDIAVGGTLLGDPALRLHP